MTGQLIDNAVKFTHNGKIELVAERHLDGSSDDLVIHVVDTGIGIASDQIANLFEKFTVADDSSTSNMVAPDWDWRSARSSQADGRRIFVERVRKGKPLYDPGAAAHWKAEGGYIGSATLVPAASDFALETTMHKILLAEDNEINRDMLTRRLQRHGFSVCCAHDGAAGVEMAASEMPDLILMDVALGAMDGWEATQLIKANPATSAIPIVALTAHALASDRDKSVEVGCSDFDTKPVDMQRLLGKIRGCLPATARENAVA
jgi:CheY-like chemotaxis protein